MTKEKKDLSSKDLPLKDLPEGLYLKCSGTYYARYRGSSGVEGFETYLLFSKVNIDLEKQKHNLLSTVQNQMINQHMKALPKEFPNFYECRECRIIDTIYNFKSTNVAKATCNPSMISSMTMEELKLFVFENNLFTKVDNFSTIMKARAEVRNDYENKKIADKFEAERKKKEKKKFKAE